MAKKSTVTTLSFYAFAFLATVFLSLIIGGIAYQLSESLGHADSEAVALVSGFGDDQVELFTLVTGFVGITLIGLCIAFPLGVCGSIYIECIAQENWARKLLLGGIDTLTRLPAVIIGIFGFFLVNRWEWEWDYVAQSMILALMFLPTIMNTTLIALGAAMRANRDSGPWEEIRSRVLDTARPGILTGVAIAVLRSWSEIIITAFVAIISLGLISPLGENAPPTFGGLFHRILVEATNTETIIGKLVVLLILVTVTNAFINWILKNFALGEFGKLKAQKGQG